MGYTDTYKELVQAFEIGELPVDALSSHIPSAFSQPREEAVLIGKQICRTETIIVAGTDDDPTTDHEVAVVSTVIKLDYSHQRTSESIYSRLDELDLLGLLYKCEYYMGTSINWQGQLGRHSGLSATAFSHRRLTALDKLSALTPDARQFLNRSGPVVPSLGHTVQSKITNLSRAPVGTEIKGHLDVLKNVGCMIPGLGHLATLDMVSIGRSQAAQSSEEFAAYIAWLLDR